MQVRVWCLLLILASCTSTYDYIDQFVDQLLLSRPEVRQLLVQVVQQQQLAARHPEQTHGRSLSRGDTQGRFLNSLFSGQGASDPFLADSASFLQDVNSADQRRCIPRLLCSAVSGIFGPGATAGAVTPAPPVGPPSPPTVGPPAPPTRRPRPPAPPTARPPAPPTRSPAPPIRPAPPSIRPPAPPTSTPAPPTPRPQPPAPPTSTPAPPIRPPSIRPPAPPTSTPAPPTPRPQTPAPPTPRPQTPAPPTRLPPPPVVRPPAPPVTTRPRPPVVRPPAPPVTGGRPPAPPVVGPPAGRPPAPPVGPPAPPIRPPAPPSDALLPASEPFFQKPVNSAAFGPPGRSLGFRRPARFDPSSRRVALFADSAPILSEDEDPFAIESRRFSSRQERNELSDFAAPHVSGRILFVDSSGPSAAASGLSSSTDEDAVSNAFRLDQSLSAARRGRSGEGRRSGRVRFEDDVISGRSARRDFPAVIRAFSEASSAPGLPPGGRRSSRSQPDPPSGGRIRFPERRRRKRTVSIFGGFLRVLNSLAQPYSFSPYTTAALEGSTGGPRERCAQLYPQCPVSSAQGGSDFIDIFNNLNRYVPGGVNALVEPLRLPALDPFLQR